MGQFLSSALFNRKTLKDDFVAGFILFLVALPLSVGISLASGAPATAGLLSAIVGGILGSFITGGHVMINGPAAGLIVVVLTSVQTLGAGDMSLGFRLTLAAIAITGVIQIVLGALKAGRLGLMIPVHVLHGMLASIGVTIVVKQLFVLMGLKPTASKTFGQILELPTAIMQSNWIIVAIGAVCLITMVIMNSLKFKWVKLLPPSLIVVALGIIADKVLDLEHLHSIQMMNHSFEVSDKFLLHVPSGIAQAFISPDFSMVGSGVFWKMVFTICFVASIESVLSAFAVDKIDPQMRKTNLDKDLLSKGVCNFILGMIGGLPIITEIVRSTANIANGAKTTTSNFVHGAFILLFLALFPSVLNLIPLSAFAAVLIFVGFRLCHPNHFKHAFKVGWDQGVVFLVTLFFSLQFDLLVGIFVGLITDFIISAFRSKSVGALFSAPISRTETPQTIEIVVKGPSAFPLIRKLQKELLAVNSKKDFVVDLTHSSYVDHTVLDFLSNAKRDYDAKWGRMSWKLATQHEQTSEHPLSSRLLKA